MAETLESQSATTKAESSALRRDEKTERSMATRSEDWKAETTVPKTRMDCQNHGSLAGWMVGAKALC